MAKKSSDSSETIIQEAREVFEEARDFEADNRERAEDDLRFSRLGEQWDDDIKRNREREGRPCLTINKMTSFIRQVVNDARLNKPQIRVRPVDDYADIQTADVYNGIIRHIEQVSNAGIAYDTAIDYAVSMGFGYMRLDLEYIHDDTFDTEPRISAVENPFSIYGDPWATAPDGSDWNRAFVVDKLSCKEYEARYPKAEKVDWESGTMIDDDRGDGVGIVEYWERTEVPRPILLLEGMNGERLVVEQSEYEEKPEVFIGFEVAASRMTRSHKVIQRILNGAEILDENEWIGRHIPIIPVYGERINVDGKLYLRSLIHDAKDPQRMFNYWRTCSTEIVALAPKAPFIGPVGAFTTDAHKWQTAHTQTWPYIEYDPVGNAAPPQRQMFAGVPAGMIQESLNASDDIKAVVGIYDAALGARSNETSGKAIMARQREGDVSTFHFIDNLSRGISYLGTQLVDIIPKVFGPGRVVRILGESGDVESSAKIGPQRDYSNPQSPVYDLGAGRYDLVVDVGPSFTTRREEAATQMMELIRAYPAAATVIGDLLVKNLDWPGADEIAERLNGAMGGGGGEDQSKMLEEFKQKAQQMEVAYNQLKADQSLEAEKLKIEIAKLRIEEFKAQTDRMEAQAKIVQDRAGLSLEQAKIQQSQMERQAYDV